MYYGHSPKPHLNTLKRRVGKRKLKKAIIFDMDGTLFQTHKILENSLEETFTYLRDHDLWEKETPIQKYREIMGVPLPVVWETLLPKHSDEVREEANRIFHIQLIQSILNGQGELYPHAEETFNQLVKEFKIYIASNGQKEYLKAIVDYYKLDRWVRKVYSIEEICSRNKSELVSFIKETHGISEGIVVGDRLSDFMAAKHNQFLSIGCDFDFSVEDELIHADIVIKDLSKLINCIQNI